MSFFLILRSDQQARTRALTGEKRDVETPRQGGHVEAAQHEGGIVDGMRADASLLHGDGELKVIEGGQQRTGTQLPRAESRSRKGVALPGLEGSSHEDCERTRRIIAPGQLRHRQ